MYQPLRIQKNVVKKLELVITCLLLLYYLGINVPTQVIQTWALFGFVTVPLLIISHWKQVIWVVTKDLVLNLLIIAVPSSILWSTSPDSTLAYSRAFLCSTAFGIYLATRYTPKELMRLLLWFLSVFTCLSFILPLIVPSYGINFDYPSGPAWRGLNSYKNDLAAIMTATIMLFLNIVLYSRRYRLFALSGAVLAFLVLWFSKGKTSLGVFTGMLFLLPLYKIARQEYRLKTFLSICFIMIGGVITITTLANLDFIVIDILGKDLGGNGRDKLWAYLIQRGLEKPWLGYGYAGFWSNRDEGLGVALETPWLGGAGEGGGNAHNSYIEVFLQLGYLGVSLLILSFLMVLFRIILLLLLTKKIEFFWMLQFLLIIALLSYFDSLGFLTYRSWTWILYVFSAYSSVTHLNRLAINHKFS